MEHSLKNARYFQKLAAALATDTLATDTLATEVGEKHREGK